MIHLNKEIRRKQRKNRKKILFRQPKGMKTFSNLLWQGEQARNIQFLALNVDII